MKINSYQDIQGWFDFENVYDFAVKNLNNCTFIEIGTWLGKSTAYLASLIRKYNKNIKLYGVDTFEGEKSCEFHVNKVQESDGTIFNEFWQNMVDLELNYYVHPVISKSTNCLSKIKEKNIGFIFIDGAHDYNSVYQDLEYLYPHVLNGGLIAGHDYNSECKNAVDTFFKNIGKEVTQVGVSWLVQK